MRIVSKVVNVLLFSLIFSIALNGAVFDNLVIKEKYFTKAMEKSKINEYGKDKVIAVLDSGINDDNDELRGQVIAEYDFTTNSEIAIDRIGHGTKMASIIASKNNDQGITGIAYQAKLIDVKVVADNEKITTENIIKGIHFAVKHNANVINMSFSSGEYSKELESIIDQYTKKGIIFVAAAGNDGEKAMAYPAGYKNVIAVSSLKRGTDKKAIYANYGEHINEYVEDGIWTYDGKKYSREYGTSEACAVVSGYIQDNYIKEENINKLKRNEYQISGFFKPSFKIQKNVFEDDDTSSYLNSLINYQTSISEVTNIFPAINELRLAELTNYSSNPLVAFTELGSALDLNEKINMNAYIILFDIFKGYYKATYKNENLDLDKNALQTSIDIIEIIKGLKKEFDSNKNNIKAMEKVHGYLLKLATSTKGKTDYVSKMIRKYARVLSGEFFSEDIGSFKTDRIKAKANFSAEKAFKKLNYLITLLNFIKNLDTTLEQIAYLKVFALDFVY